MPEITDLFSSLIEIGINTISNHGTGQFKDRPLHHIELFTGILFSS